MTLVLPISKIPFILKEMLHIPKNLKKEKIKFSYEIIDSFNMIVDQETSLDLKKKELAKNMREYYKDANNYDSEWECFEIDNIKT